MRWQRLCGQVVLLTMLCGGHAALSDPYEEFFRDFIVIRERTEACSDAATSISEAISCVGRATLACTDPNSDWPYGGNRDCAGEILVWRNLHDEAFMELLIAARRDDFRELMHGGAPSDDLLYALMKVGMTWRAHASAQCAVEALPDADQSYEYRMAHPSDCMERMYAARIFALRHDDDVRPYGARTSRP
jgi:hypothetical protein